MNFATATAELYPIMWLTVSTGMTTYAAENPIRNDEQSIDPRTHLHLIRTRRAFRQTVQRSLRQHNIDMTFEMLQVMHRLWQEQGISQQRLAERTSKNKASLTNLINNLIKKGWVSRREDDTDRRNRLIFLTPAGEALAQVVRPRLADIRRMHEQGLVTRNDCLRSELELTDYRLTARETGNNWKSTVYIHNSIRCIHLRIRRICFL